MVIDNINNVVTVGLNEDFLDAWMSWFDSVTDRDQTDFSGWLIVFGGKRPNLFIKKRLAQRIKGAYLPPKFLALDEWVQQIVSDAEIYTVMPELESCYTIYRIICEYDSSLLNESQTFADFLPWAIEISRFIDQLDMEAVDNKMLSQLEANADIGYDVPDTINRLLQSIQLIRTHYHNRLRSRKIYSKGFIYLRAQELLDQQSFHGKVAFCNLFYLTKTQLNVVKACRKSTETWVLIQGDKDRWSVLKNMAQQMGFELGQVSDQEANRSHIQLYSGFDVQSQMSTVRKILSQSPADDDTLIMLAHPDLIMPLIGEISDLLSEYNISMGYPLKSSSLSAVIKLIFAAQTSRRQQRYYARDYLKVLRHPFIKNLKIFADAEQTRILIHVIEDALTGQRLTEISGRLFFALSDVEKDDVLIDVIVQNINVRPNQKLTESDVREKIDFIHQQVFRVWEVIVSFSHFCQTMTGFIDMISSQGPIKAYPLNVNIAAALLKELDHFSRLEFANEPFPFDDIKKIFIQQLDGMMIPFLGTPLKGLQILGLFETRSLSFKRVITINVNEGRLPVLNEFDSFIPREVFRLLEIPRLELEEDIQRYQFRRLLASAEEAHIIYLNNPKQERSRFIEELIWEEEQHHQSLHVMKTKSYEYQVNMQQQIETIPKSDQALAIIQQMTFSPSSINTYLNNSLDFYKRYILGVKEADDLLDETDGRHIGVFIHEFLETLYRPWVGRILKFDETFMRQAMNVLDEMFDQHFDSRLRPDSFMMKTIVIERLRRFLLADIENIHRHVDSIIGLEEECQMQVKCGEKDIPFRFVIDRIDRLKDGSILVMDYKTGFTDLIPSSWTILNDVPLDRASMSTHVKSFQLPLYFHYVSQSFAETKVNAALYGLRDAQMKFLLSDKFENDHRDVWSAFHRHLEALLTEIFDPDQPFVNQTYDR